MTTLQFTFHNGDQLCSIIAEQEKIIISESYRIYEPIKVIATGPTLLGHKLFRDCETITETLLDEAVVDHDSLCLCVGQSKPITIHNVSFAECQKAIEEAQAGKNGIIHVDLRPIQSKERPQRPIKTYINGVEQRPDELAP